MTPRIPLFLAATVLMSAAALPATAQVHVGRQVHVEPVAVVSPNTVVRGELDLRDEHDGRRFLDRLTLDVRRGQTVTLDLRSDDFDTAVRVEAGGWVVAENDDRGRGSTDSLVSFVASDNGAVEIVVTSWAANVAGAYTLSIAVDESRLPRRDAWRGGSILGELDRYDERDRGGSYRDRHFVDLDRGDEVAVLLSSSDFDTTLEIWLDGRLVAENDDRRIGDRDSEVRFEASYAGTYEIVVSSFHARETGRYALTVDIDDARPVHVGHIEPPVTRLPPPPPIDAHPPRVRDERPVHVDQVGYLPDPPVPHPHRRGRHR